MVKKTNPRPIAVTALLFIFAMSICVLTQNATPQPMTPVSRNSELATFGVRGDGVADDTDALQRAIAARIGTIHLPPGSYRISRTLEVSLEKHGFTAFAGDGTARLIMTAPGAAIRFVGTHGGTADPTTTKPSVWKNERMPIVDGIEIIGEHPEADGIEATGTMQLTVTRTNIRKVRHGIHLVDRNRNVLIANCHIYDNSGVGVFLDRVNLHQTNINGCHISYNKQGGVVVRGGEVRNVHINGCDIEANMAPDTPPTANVFLDCAEGSFAEVAISGCTIQHESKTPNSANIRILGNGKFPRRGEVHSVNVGHVTIADNVLSDVKVNVELVGARGVTIVGNTFWQGYEHNLRVTDCSQIVVGANVMERNPIYGYTTEANNAVVFRKCRDCTISGLHVHNVRASDAGVTFDDCQRFNITGCTILDCENVGVAFNNVSDSRLSNCLICDDRDVAQKSVALKISGGTNLQVSDNLLKPTLP